MTEVRNRKEGSLYRVQASGSGNTWSTASAASGVVFAFVRNFTWTSAQTTQQVMERGVPSHHKIVSNTPITLDMTVAYGVTAHYPTRSTAGGATVPMDHVEFKESEPENGSTSAHYYQFYGVSWDTKTLSEADTENTYQLRGVALGMRGPTASGYLG